LFVWKNLSIFLDATLSNPENSTQEKPEQELDLSPVSDENTNKDLTKTLLSPRSSLTSNSTLQTISRLIDAKDITSEFLERNSEDFQSSTIETITTPLQSSSTSHEDLRSLVKTENSHDDLLSMNGSNYVFNPLPRTTTTTSKKHLYSDEENNEQAERLCPEVRQILGWLIGLPYEKNDLT